MKDLNLRKQIRGYVVKSGLEVNLVVWSSLAHMYMQSGSSREGERVIKRIPIHKWLLAIHIARRAQQELSEGALDQYNNENGRF